MSEQELAKRLDGAFARWQSLSTEAKVLAVSRFFGRMDGQAVTGSKEMKRAIALVLPHLEAGIEQEAGKGEAA